MNNEIVSFVDSRCRNISGTRKQETKKVEWKVFCVNYITLCASFQFGIKWFWNLCSCYPSSGMLPCCQLFRSWIRISRPQRSLLEMYWQRIMPKMWIKYMATRLANWMAKTMCNSWLYGIKSTRSSFGNTISISWIKVLNHNIIFFG